MGAYLVKYLIGTLEDNVKSLKEQTKIDDDRVLLTLTYFEGDLLAASVFLKKYALRNHDNKVMEWTYEETKQRMAREMERHELDTYHQYKQPYSYFKELYDYFIPGGRQIYGLGNHYQPNITLSNCFVIKIHEDSIEGIFECAKKAARIYSYGGGMGIDLSVLRPTNARVSNSAHHSSGAVSFADFYSYITGLIGIHGRRGALLLSMIDSHPDIEYFINLKKENLDNARYANLSIRITNSFMDAVEQNKDWVLSFTTKHETISRTIKATDLWNKIVTAARDSAEPGILFWDNIIHNSPSDIYKGYEVVTTNPCGEVPLDDGNSCNLAHLILNKFVINPYQQVPIFNWTLFKEMITRGVRHLDNILTISIDKQPLEQIKDKIRKTRRIGLGITGLADMFAALNIRYDSNEALDFSEKLMRVKRDVEYIASSNLAKERGSFEIFDEDIHFTSGFTKQLPPQIKEYIRINGLRNITLSTVAPVGSGSIIAQTTSGMEPLFKKSYLRYTNMGNNKERQEFEVMHQGIVRCMECGGDPSIYREAHEIDWRFRIKLQSVTQLYTDSSISSTINIPEHTTVEEVKDIYMEAWKAKLKGITLYREGSREGILVSKDHKQNEDNKKVDTDTKIYKFIAESGDKFYVAISYRDSNITKPYQIFITNYKKSQDDRLEKVAAVLQTLFDTTDALVEKQLLRCKLNIDKITRLISLAMKENKVKEVVEVLESLAIVGTLPYYLIKILSIEAEGDCPDCGNKLIREGGCIICSQGCGWSKC